jgi:hypothetical protein
MRSQRPIVYLAAAAILGICQTGLAQAKEEDSAYHWGRWAVLSPAAGGAEPYVAAKTPGAEFNARPGDASQFQPEILSVGTAPVTPGIGDVNPDIPVVTVPPSPPPPPPVALEPGIGDVNPGVPVVTVPPSPPPPPPAP